MPDLKGIWGFLEKEYEVEVYTDSADKEMPKKTSGVTAQRIKEKIKECDHFILIATNKAIASKWCNWELGYGDAFKYKKKIAIFPMKPSYNETFNGHEYLYIYPRIILYDGTEKYDTGERIAKGYYVCTQESVNETRIITPLREWLR